RHGRRTKGVETARRFFAFLELLAAELADETGDLRVLARIEPCRSRSEQQRQRKQRVHRGASHTRRVQSCPPESSRRFGPKRTRLTRPSCPSKRCTSLPLC